MSAVTTIATLSSRPSADGTGLEFFITDAAGQETALVTDAAVEVARSLDAPTAGRNVERALRTAVVAHVSAQLAAQQEALRSLDDLGEAAPDSAAPAPEEAAAEKPKARRGRRPRAAEAAEPVAAEPVADPAAEFAALAQAVADFREAHGTWPSSSSSDATEKPLGQFLTNQRARGLSPAMPADRRLVLDQVIPGWTGESAPVVTPEPVAEPVAEPSEFENEPVESEPAYDEPEAPMANLAYLPSAVDDDDAF